MINILLIGTFILLIFLGKKDVAIKIIQSYFTSLFIQAVDFKTRTSNVWLYIFSALNIYVISKTWEGPLNFTMDSDNSAVTIFKLVVFSLCILSSFSILVRRLHDINKPGWFLIIGIIFPPVLIILSFMFLFPGTNGSNKYGADPKSQRYWYLT